jgi:tetratricopeptide (TPR) repeat protein
MFQRIDITRTDSETALFYDLLIAGELLLKVAVAGLTAAVADDRDRNRYRIEHRLVRADGLGEWAGSLEEVITGPAAQHLAVAAYEDRRELTQRWLSSERAWQRQAVDLLEKTCDCLDPDRQNLAPAKVSLARWFDSFVWIRNRSRAHGAPTGKKCASAVETLELSIRMIADNFRLFDRPCAYLKRNLNGRYRVVPISGDMDPFAFLKKESEYVLEEGVYIFFDEPQRVRTIVTDVDLSDFFIANGNFNGRTFEALSYVTDRRESIDATPFLAPTSSLPRSETSGYPNLDVVGETFTNVPPRLLGYVHRPELERELRSLLVDERHPVITLVGRGGIGKTSLALEVIHQICAEQNFEAILWFSARDIDLMQEGPKRVAPDVLTQRDIAALLVDLLTPQGANDKGFDDKTFLNDALAGKTGGGPFLFAFDNFETVHHPIELYHLLDTYVRLPNKVLLTTRMRDFKADYPVPVSGMTREEFEELALGAASRIGIRKLVTERYLDDLYEESDGHPYVVKMLLGEVARTGRVGAVERVLAGREEVLGALFERTFQALTPAAQRVFLTLCSWRSVVSRLAVEAALLRPANERMDAGGAVDELERSSMVEAIKSASDGEEFLRVPLAAAVFGRRKLAVSALRSAVEADVEMLMLFGAARSSDVDRGLEPRVRQMSQAILARSSDDRAFEEGMGVLSFVARSYPPGWLSLADVHLAMGDLQAAESAIEQYLEREPADSEAWRKLADVRRAQGDHLGELHARVELAEAPTASYGDASHTANLLNGWLRSGALRLDGEEKRVLAARIRRLLEAGADAATAVDLSRLAWVCIHMQDRDSAKAATRRGLEVDPENEYCRALAKRLNVRL